MRRFLLLVLLMLCSAALAPALASAQLNTLLVHAIPNPSWVVDVQTKVVGGPITSMDAFDANLATPTLVQLQAYDAVLVTNDDVFQDPTALGNVLADYVNGGGGVVVAVFANTFGEPAGNFVPYQLIPSNGQSGGQAFLGTVSVPAHPVMQGVTSFDGGSSSYRAGGTAIAAGATLVASWDDGTPLVVAKNNVGPANARRVDLGFYPPSSDVRSDFWNPASDGARLMQNALAYVAGADAPLPVELSAFSGSAARGAISLSWTTATELNNAGFSVLRDGVEIASFRSSVALRGHGTSSSANRYGYTDARVVTGRAYSYTLRSVDASGATHDYPQTVEVSVPVEQITAFALSPASPNPFNPTTSLQLSLPQTAQVDAVLYDALGRPVRTLAHTTMPAGTSPLTVSADGLPSGAYLVRVTAVGAAGTNVSTQRLTLVK